MLEGLGLIGKEAHSAIVLMGENGARKLTELVRYTPIKLGRGRRSTQSHVLIHEKFQFFLNISKKYTIKGKKLPWGKRLLYIYVKY